MKLVYKILLLVVLPTAILSLLFVFFINNILYDEVEKRFLHNIENTTNDYARLIDHRLEGVTGNTKYTASRLAYRQDINKDEAKRLLRESIENDSLIYGASIFFDTTYPGQLRKSMFYAYYPDKVNKNTNNIEYINFSSDDLEYTEYFNQGLSWWEIPKKELKPTWTSPYFDEGVGNKFMITYAKPFMVNGNYAGIVTADILIEDIRDLLLVNEQRIEGKFDPDLYVLNMSDSTIIYSENIDISGEHAIKVDSNRKQNYSTDAKLKIFDMINNVNKGKGIVMSNNQSKYFVFYAPVGSFNWYVVDILSITTAQKAVYESVSKVITLVLIFVFILIILIFTTSRLITNPIRKLSTFSLEVSKGNYNKTIEVKSRDEIGVLSENFNIMSKELKRREESLKIANKQLLELDTAKNEFLNLISHEIRTPLNGIVGSTHFLNEMIKDPELADFLEMLKESVDRLDSFSKTALEITEMQTVGNKIEKTDIEIIPIINEAIEKYSDSISEKKLHVEKIIKGKNKLFGIRNYFKNSMIELISNAVKFSTPDTKIQVSTCDENNFLFIKVSNTGEVIPIEKINEIIKPFGLVNEHYDKNIGLGLTYIQKFLELHNGSIDITSNEERTDVILIFDQSKNS